jgi:hypothetical protein
VDELREGVDVGGLQLLYPAVLEDLSGQGVVEGQLLEDLLGRRRGPRLRGLPSGPEAQALEEDLAELHRGVDVERGAGERVDLPGERVELRLHLAAHRRERRAVDLDAGALHVREDLDQRQLHGLEDRLETVRLETLRHGRREAEDQLRLLGRRAGGALE